jgi:hypothetical protein
MDTPSPFNQPFVSSPSKPAAPGVKREEDDERDEIDTRSMLERMKDTVEEMKRRGSLAPSTPARSAPTPGLGGTEKIMKTPGRPLPGLSFGVRLVLGVSKKMRVRVKWRWIRRKMSIRLRGSIKIL